MTVDKVDALVKNYVKAEEPLKDISELKESWNENGAKPFSSQLIKWCQTILKSLVVERMNQMVLDFYGKGSY